MNKILLISFFSVFLIFSGCTTNKESNKPGKHDAFAQCITDSGAIFYGTQWCPHCKKQKAMFGNSLAKINYVDCDKEGLTCRKKKITGYPTWILGDGKRLEGEKSLEILAKETNCPL